MLLSSHVAQGWGWGTSKSAPYVRNKTLTTHAAQVKDGIAHSGVYEVPVAIEYVFVEKLG